MQSMTEFTWEPKLTETNRDAVIGAAACGQADPAGMLIHEYYGFAQFTDSPQHDSCDGFAATSLRLFVQDVVRPFNDDGMFEGRTVGLYEAVVVEP